MFLIRNAFIKNAIVLCERLLLVQEDFGWEVRVQSGPGRFTTGSPEIKNIAKKISSIEDHLNPNCIVAEVVHIPDDRVSNVLTRQSIRNYEIPYLCNSQLDPKFQISIDDIYVSVINDEIRLRSKRLNKYVIPRLSNAHNYSVGSLPIYLFLCDMQHAGLSTYINFDWGVLNTEFDFLPRVEINSVIVSPMKWKFNSDTIRELLDLSENGQFNRLRQRLNSKGLPDTFLVTEHDNFILINKSDDKLLSIFRNELRKSNTVNIEEFLFTSNTPNLPPNFCNEFIATLYKTQVNMGNFTAPPLSNTVTRKYNLGSEWIYFKIYCGERIADSILINSINPMIEKLQRKKYISEWFFIRYFDVESHLRVRFRLNSNANLGKIVDVINFDIKDYLENDDINNVQFETYNREIERYGEMGIELAEKLFTIDSASILQIIHLYRNQNIYLFEEISILLLIDTMISDFNLSTTERLEFIKNSRTAFASEFEAINAKEIRKKINAKYSVIKGKLHSAINREIHNESYLNLYSIINQRSLKMKPIINELIWRVEKAIVQQSIESLLASFIHMTINRFYITNQRMHEYILYEFLERYYTMVLMKDKKTRG